MPSKLYSFRLVFINASQFQRSCIYLFTYQPDANYRNYDFCILMFANSSFTVVGKNTNFIVFFHLLIQTVEAVSRRCSIKTSSEKCRKIQRKTLVLESLLNEIAYWRPLTLLKRDCSTVDFL